MYAEDVEDAPCGSCGRPVHLHDQPPCPHGFIACVDCGWESVCTDCADTVEEPAMNLRVYSELIQGSEEWHDARRGIVTASVVGKLLTPTLKVASNDTSRAVAALLVAERITGWTEETAMTSDMWRGVECEPIARDLYSKHYQEAREGGFMVRDDFGFSIGYSPDGLVGDDGLIEIKSPRAKTHLRTILDDGVPDYYMAQLQAGLLVSGRAWIDYVSFVGGMPLFVKRVKPIAQWQEAIPAAVAHFETTAADMVAAYTQKTENMPATERASLEIVI